MGLQVSEENDEPIIFEDGGDYSVVFDPLDGSSNIECGVSIGTIYGIYKKAKEEEPSVRNVLRVRGFPLGFADTWAAALRVEHALF